MKKPIFLLILAFYLFKVNFICISAQESIRILKPFGYPTLELSVSPATFLELTDTTLYEGEKFFTRSASNRNFLSFPQEDDYFLISFENYFRKEIYRKSQESFISKDFSLYIADIISLYLYDISSRQWVNPLLIISKEANSTLSLRRIIVQHQDECEDLKQMGVLELNDQCVDLFIQVASHLVGQILGSTGFYSFSLSVNGLKVLNFSTHAIKQTKGGFEWIGLDVAQQVYENGELRIKNLPLKIGLNELQIEVRDFLYRSLVYRAFIKVVKPLVP